MVNKLGFKMPGKETHHSYSKKKKISKVVSEKL